MISSRLLASSLALVAFGAGRSPAQDCVGLPSQSRGTFTAGLEGTDGATGEGLKWARHEPAGSLQLTYKGLSKVGMHDRMATFGIHGSRRLPGALRAFCFTLAPELTQYQTEYRDWIYPPSVNGLYRRVGVPIGFSLGREFAVTRWLSLVAYYNPHFIAEFERFEPDSAWRTKQSSVSYRSATGVTLVSSWFVVRSVLTIPHLSAPRLVHESRYMAISVQLGVRY